MKRTMKRILGIFLCAIMVAGTFLSPLGAKAGGNATPSGFEDWTPYLSSAVQGPNGDALESAWDRAFENGGTADAEGMIAHRWDGNKSGMIYSNKSYINFEMTFDYYAAGQDVYIGIGASEQGSTFSNQSRGLYSLMVGWKGCALLRKSPNEEIGWISSDIVNERDNTAQELDNFKTSKHSMKIKVADKKITVFISEKADGNWNERSTFDIPDYNGGYVFLASYTYECRFSAPKLGNDPSSLDRYSSYYSENIRFGDAGTRNLSKVSAGNCWREADGKIIRKTVTGDVQDDLHMAELFLKERTYTNFELNVDVTLGSSGWRRAFVGFGAEMGRHIQQSGGGTMVYLDGEWLRYGGWIKDNCTSYEEGNWGKSYSVDTGQPVHFRIVVKNKTAVVFVGDSDQTTSFSLPDSYEGGYIYLASNSTGTTYENLTVEELNAEDMNEFPEFAAYYSENVRTGDSEAKDLVEVNAANHWMRVENSIVRKTVNEEEVQDDLCMAELFLKDQQYTNFELNVDVTLGNSGWRRAFVGFGAEMGRHIQQSGGGTMVYLDGEWLRYGGWIKDNGTSYEEGNWGKSYSGDLSKPVHFRIVVMNMEVSVYVGDSNKPDTFILPSNYKGGYIYLASNSTGATFDNLLVQELTDEGNVDNSTFERFTSYYSDNIRFGDSQAKNLTATAAANYWKAKNGAIIRKKTPAGDVQDDLYMAELFLKDQKYTNFELNVDVTLGSSGWRRAFVGFGAEMGRHFQQSGGGTTVYLDGEWLRYGGWLNGKDYTEGNWGREHRADTSRPIHIRMVVVGGNVSVYVGNNAKATTFSLPNSYKGGYIFLASNSMNTTFANLTVENIPDDAFNNFKNFSSYYTNRVGKSGLQKADPALYWSELGGVITRRLENVPDDTSGTEWNETSYHLNQMAYLFLEGDYTKYDNYVVELDYKSGIGAWGRAYMGFGATGASTWREKNGGTVFFVDGGGNTCFEGSFTENGTIDKSVTGVQLKNYSDKETHHFKLVCNGGIYNLYVDGIEVKTMVENKYNRGGKFFLASNSTATEFSNIKVTKLPNDRGSFRGYDEWYSKDISKTALKDVPEGTNWSIVNGVITRKAIEPKLRDSMNKYDMAYLYLTNKKYTNFKVEFDYKHGISGWLRAPIGFGAELGKSYMDENGGMAVFSQPDGIVQFIGNVNQNGVFDENVFWPSYDKNGKNMTTIAPYNANQWHHVVLEVMDGYAVAQFDNFSYYYEVSIPAPYEGGYIYLCSNSAAAQYKNLKITDLNVVDDPTAQAGWQPEEKDRAYDYGFRKVVADVVKWIYKKLKYIYK